MYLIQTNKYCECLTQCGSHRVMNPLSRIGSTDILHRVWNWLLLWRKTSAPDIPILDYVDGPNVSSLSLCFVINIWLLPSPRNTTQLSELVFSHYNSRRKIWDLFHVLRVESQPRTPKYTHVQRLFCYA